MLAANKSSRSLPVSVGLLGGGQLARMLVLKGHEMGLTMKVLCRDENEPAAFVTSHIHFGDPSNEKDVLEFSKHCDVLTFESEFVSGEMLQKIPGTLSPSASVVRLLQDRLSQKQALFEAKIPTAPFMTVHNFDDLALAASAFDGKFVLKKRTGGYDGYGTVIVRNAAEFKKAHELDFEKSQWIAEGFVPFKRELALQLARNRRGQISVFPLVETHQENQRLDWLQGPVKHRGLAPLVSRLKVFLKKIDYVGLIAFELFETAGKLSVNEIAPRVHNSGHASLEALNVDQFTQHLRAILDLDLVTPKVLTGGFAMANLIGAGAAQPAFPVGLESHLHWYGKSESRAGRKMGHLTLTGKNAKACLKQVLKERKGFKL